MGLHVFSIIILFISCEIENYDQSEYPISTLSDLYYIEYLDLG